MAVELATAYVTLVPSFKGGVGSIARELAPIEGAAAESGTRAGQSFGSKLTGELQQALPGASGPIGTLMEHSGALFGGALVLGFAGALIGIAQQFGAARNQIIQETGQTGAALEGTFSAVKAVFADVPASLHDVTTAVDELRQRGVPLGATLNTLAKQELELSKITKTDLGTNVETTTALFGKFQVALKDQPGALDAIFKASQQSGKGLADLLENMRSGGTSLTQFGFGIKQSAALIATLEKAGVEVQPALTGLKKAFGQLASSGQDPKKALSDLIHEFDAGRDPAKAMADAMTLFGKKSGAELAVAIQRGKFSVSDLLKVITDGKGGILDTAESTRTLAERFELLKNKAEVALLPLASAVWAGVKEVFAELEPPVSHLVQAIASLGVALAPLAAALGVLLFGALKAAVPIIDAFATGVDTIASALSAVPTPVLIVAGALGGLALVITQLAPALTALQLALNAQGFVSFLSDLNPVVAGLVIGAAAVTALGAVMQLFQGDASAAAVEAKSLADALIDTSHAAGLFKSGVADATSGFANQLKDLDAAGKLKNLDAALKGTAFNLQDVARAATGTSQDFERLKSSLVDTSGIDQQNLKLVGLSDSSSEVQLALNGLSDKQAKLVAAATKSSQAIDQQREAFLQFAEGSLQAAKRSGDLKDVQLGMAEGIAHATTGIRGYGAALDFASQAISENIAKQAAEKVAAADQAGTLTQLRAAIVSGVIGTNDAATAAAHFGLQLDSTKQIISDTQAALKKFIDEGVGKIPTTLPLITAWQQNVQKAFDAVAASSGKSSKTIAADQQALRAALDPRRIIDAMQAQTKAIVEFQTNVGKLIAKFPATAQRLIAEGPEVGGLLAAKLADDKKMAGQFELVQIAANQGVANLTAQEQGPWSQQIGAASGFMFTGITGAAGKVDLTTPVAGQVAGAAAALTQGAPGVASAAGAVGSGATTAYTGSLNLQDPTAQQTAAANAAIVSAAPQFGAAAQSMAGGAFNEFVNKLTLGGFTVDETDRVQKAIRAGADPATVAAAYLSNKATGSYGDNLGLVDKTTVEMQNTSKAFGGQARILLAGSAQSAGKLVGRAFDVGMAQGIDQNIGKITAAAQRAADAIPAPIRKLLGIASPSRVGVEIGQQFTAGIVDGLTSGGASITGAAARSVAGLNDTRSIEAALARLTAIIANLRAQTAQAAIDQVLAAARAALAQFVTQAVAQLPTAATAISTFSTTSAAALAKLQQAIQAGLDAHKKLRDDLAAHADLSTIQADEKAITDARTAHEAARREFALASNPAAFIAGLNKQSGAINEFQADIKKLADEGFTDLAKQLAEQGPAAAGKLADALAKTPRQAKLAEEAIDRLNRATGNFGRSLEHDFAASFGVTGKDAGAVFSANLAAGLSSATGATLEQAQAIVRGLESALKPATALGTLVGNAVTSAIDVLKDKPLPAPKIPDPVVPKHPVVLPRPIVPGPTIPLPGVLKPIALPPPVVGKPVLPKVTFPRPTLPAPVLPVVHLPVLTYPRPILPAPKVTAPTLPTIANPAVAGPAASTAAASGPQKLDLTIVLEDGRTVQVRDVTLTQTRQRLMAEVEALAHA